MATQTSPGGDGDQLTLGYLFVNGLRSKVDDVRALIEKHNIDVLALCRTNLDSSINNDAIHIHGFQVERRDRSPGLGGGPRPPGGGLVIYFKEGFVPMTVTTYVERYVEIMWLPLIYKDWKPLLVGCCYRPTRTGNEYLGEINMLMQDATQDDIPEKYIFLMGTFNIDWREESQQKRAMREAAERSGLRQIVNEPYNDNTEKVIDHIYTNIQETIPVQTIDDTPSDHRLFLVRVNRNSSINTKGGSTGGATGGPPGGPRGGATGKDELSSKMEKLDIKES